MFYLHFSKLKSFQNFASLGSYDTKEETSWGIQKERWKLQTFAETEREWNVYWEPSTNPATQH